VALLSAFKNWQVSGDVARQLVPYLKIILVLVLFALFPFFLIMMMTPFRMRFLKTYFFLFAWLAMWEPLMSVLNYVVSILLSGTFDAFNRAVIGSMGGYNLANMAGIYEQATTLLSIGSWFVAAVPFVALALVKGSEYALSHLAAGISGISSSVGRSVAARTVDPAARGKTLGEATAIAESGTSFYANQHAMSTYFSMQKMYGENRGLSFAQAFPGGISGVVANRTTHSVMSDSMKSSTTGLVEGTKLVGGTQAFLDGYRNAVKNGFKGSYLDYAKSMSQQTHIDWQSRVKSDISAAIKSGLLKSVQSSGYF